MSKTSLVLVTMPAPGVSSAASGCHQLADVKVAGSNHAVEWGLDTFKGLQFFQPVHVGLCGCDLGVSRLELRSSIVVRVLLRDRVLSDQTLVAISGDLGQQCVALRGRQVGLGLGELLIELRGFDLCQQFSFVHMSADVLVPGLYVARGSSVDGRQGEGLHVARQHDLPCALLKERLRQRYGWGGHGVGVVD